MFLPQAKGLLPKKLVTLNRRTPPPISALPLLEAKLDARAIGRLVIYMVPS